MGEKLLKEFNGKSIGWGWSYTMGIFPTRRVTDWYVDGVHVFTEMFWVKS